jgi:hypothetical protein
MESMAVLFLYETEHGDLFCHMMEDLSRVGKRTCLCIKMLYYCSNVFFYKNDQNTDGSHSPKNRSVTA